MKSWRLLVGRKENTEATLIRYLLGEMSEQEQSRLEAKYFADDRLFEALLVIEDELIDGYARGEFSEKESARISKHFLHSQARRRRVALAGALTKYIAVLQTTAPPYRLKLTPRWWRILSSILRPDR